MAFWSDSNSLEPLRQYRWYIYFGKKELLDYVYALKEATKPSYKIDTSAHVLINHTFNYPKNLVWQPITIKMVTARNHCNCELLSQAVEDHTHRAGYEGPHMVQKKQLGKMLMSDALLSLEIVQVDEDGKILERWELRNPMITEVKYGTLTYEQEGFVDTDLTVVYDYAIFHPGSEGATKPSGLNTNAVSPGFPSDPPKSDPKEWINPFPNRSTPINNKKISNPNDR